MSMIQEANYDNDDIKRFSYILAYYYKKEKRGVRTGVFIKENIDIENSIYHYSLVISSAHTFRYRYRGVSDAVVLEAFLTQLESYMRHVANLDERTIEERLQTEHNIFWEGIEKDREEDAKEKAMIKKFLIIFAIVFIVCMLGLHFVPKLANYTTNLVLERYYK